MLQAIFDFFEQKPPELGIGPIQWVLDCSSSPEVGDIVTVTWPHSRQVNEGNDPTMTGPFQAKVLMTGEDSEVLSKELKKLRDGRAAGLATETIESAELGRGKRTKTTVAIDVEATKIAEDKKKSIKKIDGVLKDSLSKMKNKKVQAKARAQGMKRRHVLSSSSDDIMDEDEMRYSKMPRQQLVDTCLIQSQELAKMKRVMHENANLRATLSLVKTLPALMDRVDVMKRSLEKTPTSAAMSAPLAEDAGGQNHPATHTESLEKMPASAAMSAPNCVEIVGRRLEKMPASAAMSAPLAEDAGDQNHPATRTESLEKIPASAAMSAPLAEDAGGQNHPATRTEFCSLLTEDSKRKLQKLKAMNTMKTFNKHVSAVLMVALSREQLAKFSVSGKTSNAFKNHPAKPKLPDDLLEQIIGYFHECYGEEVTTKTVLKGVAKKLASEAKAVKEKDQAHAQKEEI